MAMAGYRMATVPSQAAPSLAGRGKAQNLRSRFVRLSVTAEESSTSTATPAAPKRKPSPLERGGTLSGEAALGKDASAAVKATVTAPGDKVVMQIVDGKFRDFRWKEGRWDLSLFQNREGQMDWPSWNAVIDCEMERRKILEDAPIPSINEEPVVFDTAEIPWWAWVRRFHLPEAEKINGRAAMVGYFLAYGVDKVTGVGLYDQQNSFLGLLLLHLTVFALLIFRSHGAIPAYKNLIDEATFYDKQWAATWEGQERPSENES